jgi:nickel/cobalt transporter (NicO) family protein
MKHQALLLLLLFMMIPAVSSYGQNPFTSSSNSGSGESGESAVEEEERTDTYRVNKKPLFPVLSNLSTRLRLLQRRFHRALSETMTELKNDPSPKLLISLLAAAFMYGFVHALGPGHRKTVLAGLFAGGRYRSRDAFIAGMGFALLHGGSAVILLLMIYAFIAGPLSSGMEATGAILEKGSFFILALVGLWMIISALREIVGKRNKSKPEKKGSYAIPVVIAAGLVPCPGAALILSFAIAYQVIPLGIVAVSAMSIGMGSALFLIAAATGKAGRLIAEMGSSTGKEEKIGQGLELAGGIVITLFALSMFLTLL